MTIPFRVNPMVQVNLKKIGGLLLHETVKLLVTIDGFYQRMWRDFGVISRGAKESHEFCQWNEDDSWRRLIAGWDWGCNWNREGELDCHREDEESQLPERLRNLSITPSDTGHAGRTTREAEEAWWWSDRALERWRITTESMHVETWWTLHEQGSQKL